MYDSTVGLTRSYSPPGPIPPLPPGGDRQPIIDDYRLAPYPPLGVGGPPRYVPGPIPAHPNYPGGMPVEGMGSEGYDMGDVAGYNRFRYGRARVGSYIAPPSVGVTMMH